MISRSLCLGTPVNLKLPIPLSSGGFLWRPFGSLRIRSTASKFDVISAVRLLLAGGAPLENGSAMDVWNDVFFAVRCHLAQVVARLVNQPVLAASQLRITVG